MSEIEEKEERKRERVEEGQEDMWVLKPPRK